MGALQEEELSRTGAGNAGWKRPRNGHQNERQGSAASMDIMTEAEWKNSLESKFQTGFKLFALALIDERLQGAELALVLLD